MSGRIIVQRRSGAARVANVRSALVKKSHFEKTRIPFLRMFAMHLPRVPEEGVQSRRLRNLLEDNPTSG